MVDNGSPIGVKAAPSPIEKQEITVNSTSCLLCSERLLIINTNTRAAIIAVIILESSPKPITTNAINNGNGILWLIVLIALPNWVWNHLKSTPAMNTAKVILIDLPERA